MSSTTHPEVLETIEETLTKLDPEIRLLARHWSRECPGDWEDLAQEARVAIYLELKENPASPRTHLFHAAKCQILVYSSKGKSVDGRLRPDFRRKRVWAVVNLDAPYIVADRSNLYFKPHQLRPVEDLALTLVAYGELMERLTEQQGQYLCLKLQGHYSRAVDRLLGVSKQQGQRLRREIKEEAAEILLDT